MVWLNRSVNDCAVARSARDKTGVAPRLLSEVLMNPQSTVRAALRQPLFWVALVVLLLNDHVLKGAGVLPDWLTGKLSDFAGLVVAPLVLTALLRGRRAWAFVAVGGWFTAVNLVPEAARASEAAMGLLGISWRLWTDPTDLVALAAMPIAWTMTERGETRVRRRGLEHAAVLIGAFACMATSREPEPVGGTGPVPAPPPNGINLQNNLGNSVEVRVRWVEGSLDCEAVEADLGRALHRNAFGPGITYRMERGSYASLAREETTRRECDAALVQSTQFEERILFWRPDQVRSVPTTIVIDEFFVSVPGTVSEASPQEALATAFCPERENSEIYGWTSLGSTRSMDGVLAQVEDTIDGCLELTFETEEILFLCVPRASWPFEVGDHLYLYEEQSGSHGRRLDVERLRNPDGTPLPARHLVVYTGTDETTLGGDFARVEIERGRELCGGDRLACGAYRIATGVELYTTVGPMPIAPGELVTLDANDAITMSIAVGRAERIAYTNADCGVDRDDAGTSMDIALTYWEEIE